MLCTLLGTWRVISYNLDINPMRWVSYLPFPDVWVSELLIQSCGATQWRSWRENQVCLLEVHSLFHSTVQLCSLGPRGDYKPLMENSHGFFLGVPGFNLSWFSHESYGRLWTAERESDMLQKQGVEQMGSVCLNVSSPRNHSQEGGSAAFSCVD